MIPTHTLAFGNTDKVVMYTQGKITPIFRTLYANAEYGDMTRTRPDARRVNTWTCAVACAPRLAKTSTSPTGLAPAPAPGNRSSVHQAFAGRVRFATGRTVHILIQSLRFARSALAAASLSHPPFGVASEAAHLTPCDHAKRTVLRGSRRRRLPPRGAGDRRRGPGAGDGPSDPRVPRNLRAFAARARMHFGLPSRRAHQRGHAVVHGPRPDGVRESGPLDQPRVRRSRIQAGRHDQRFLRRPTARVLRGQESVPRRRLPRQARIQPRRLVRKETWEWTAGARLPHDFAHGHGPREVADPPDRAEGSRGPDRVVPRARGETVRRGGPGSDRRRTHCQSPRGRLGLLVRIDAEPHEVEAVARQFRGGGEDPRRLCGSD